MTIIKGELKYDRAGNEILHRKQLLVIILWNRESSTLGIRFSWNAWAKDVDGLNNKGKKVLEEEVSENAKVDGEGVGRKGIRFIMKGKGKQVMNDPEDDKRIPTLSLQHGAEMEYAWSNTSMYPIEKEKEKDELFEAKARLEHKIAKKEAKLEHIELRIAKSKAHRQRIKNRIAEMKQCRTDLE
ncbi:hypothetical protein KY289_026184 [Solanum tuberosum]|nr:hypothetical protein KY289_026184 [Solanum tuberosum]